MKKFYILILLSAFIFHALHADDNYTSVKNDAASTSILQKESESTLTKEKKLLYLNIAANVALVAYGFENWGYDIMHTKPHAQSEKWFQKDTKHGGADKFGHAYVGYLSSHMFSYAYEDWGYSHEKSSLYGAYSSFLFTTVMEIGDSFSAFGLSYEDMISNTLGAILGYYTYKYDEFGDILDFRVEYKIRKDIFDDDFTTDYENIKYLFALKASGVDSLKNTHMKYLELYAGYNINGFHQEPYERERNYILGLGLNLSKIFDTKIFKYYQVPDIYLAKELSD